MYSVVLAAMLMAGADAPAWGRGCHGCHGCCGGCFGCFGGCHGCHGCCGGCCGGCYGCCGGCCGGCWSCYGCCGGCWSYSCYGCCGGCYGCCGGVVVTYPVVATPVVAPVVTAPIKVSKLETSAPASDEAKVLVRLPADAQLMVDGKPVDRTGANRTVFTPKLPAGQEFAYTIRAEVVREGATRFVERRVSFRAGETKQVDLGDMGDAVAVGTVPAAAPAQINVQVPAGARLLVDGQVVPLTTENRSFATPKLEPGRSYSYTLTAEVVSNGQTLKRSEVVRFEAGKSVRVDLRNLEPIATASR